MASSSGVAHTSVDTNGAVYHPDAIEMKPKNSLDVCVISLDTGQKGDGPKDGGTTDTQTQETKQHDSGKKCGELIVDEGVTYDDTDWAREEKEAISNAPEGTKGDNPGDNFIGKSVQAVQRGSRTLMAMINRHTKGYMVPVVCLVAYAAYFVAAMIHERLESSPSIRLLVGTALIVLIKTRAHWMQAIARAWTHLDGNYHDRVMLARKATRWFLYIALFATMLYVIVVQSLKDVRNLQPIPGLIVMCLVCLFASTAPSHVNWHTIYWSLCLQFLCAIFVLRTDFGANAMQWTQDRFNEYFANTQAASAFLFGESYREHYVIFGAFPVLIFSNATLCLLYFIGAIQLIINCIGTVLNFVLDTSPIESTGVAAGIFLEGVMALLSLKPYIGRLTRSQLFLLTTSCYSSLGGAYISIIAQFGVRVSDIIPAMLMSAPATFTVCKLLMPEVSHGNKVKVDSTVNEERQKNNNVLEVVNNGAISILSLLANIIAIIFAVFSFISWINNTLGWFGDRVGIDDLTIELIFSYALYPVALCMGVEFRDCRRVATLLGFRLGSGNLVAFQEMAKMRANRDIFYDYMNATNHQGEYSTYRDDIIIGNQTLALGYINERSERMMTYAMCGFSSIVSVSLNLGIVITMIPRRRWWLSRVFLVSLVAGNLSNCMTGAFAGIFYYN